jgi:MFS family permease
MSLSLAALSLASGITSSGLTLYITENYTTLKENGQIQPTPLGRRLIGSYGNVWTAISAVAIALSTLYLVLYLKRFGAGWFSNSLPGFNKTQKIMHALMLSTLMVVIASCALNVFMTDNYSLLGSAVSETSSGTLRGSYGTAIFAMAIVSLCFSGITGGMHGWRMVESYRKSEEFDSFLYKDEWTV